MKRKQKTFRVLMNILPLLLWFIILNQLVGLSWVWSLILTISLPFVVGFVLLLFHLKRYVRVKKAKKAYNR